MLYELDTSNKQCIVLTYDLIHCKHKIIYFYIFRISNIIENNCIEYNANF